MAEFGWAFVVGAWMVEALVLGYAMGRRGYEAYSWTVIGLFLGPIALVLALSVVFRPPSREPRFLRAGRRGAGGIDLLVGIDGSPESDAAVGGVGALFGALAGRVTLARVVPLDATLDAVRGAEAQLTAACAAHPELDPSTVVLRGEPVAALRDHAALLGYKVLVIGTRGEGRSKAVSGSTATGLARGAGIPVLLVDDEPVGTSATRPPRAPRAVSRRDRARRGARRRRDDARES